MDPLDPAQVLRQLLSAEAMTPLSERLLVGTAPLGLVHLGSRFDRAWMVWKFDRPTSPRQTTGGAPPEHAHQGLLRKFFGSSLTYEPSP